jgi:hypothetical protein
VSGVEPPKRFEWTPLYFKELRVVGSNGFGVESVAGVAKHAMLHYFDFVGAGFDLTPVITHRFALERWDEAVLALKDPGRTGAVKVLLEPDSVNDLGFRLEQVERSAFDGERDEAGVGSGGVLLAGVPANSPARSDINVAAIGAGDPAFARDHQEEL